LIALSERRPVSESEVQKIPDLSKQLMHKFLTEVLQIIVTPHGGEPLPQSAADQPLTPAMRAQLKRCQEEVASIALDLGIAPEVLARKKQLLLLLTESAAAGKLVWPQDMRQWRQEVLESRFASILKYGE
jgi:ribonuclease D